MNDDFKHEHTVHLPCLRNKPIVNDLVVYSPIVPQLVQDHRQTTDRGGYHNTVRT